MRIVEWSNPRGNEKLSASQLRKAFAAVFHSIHAHLGMRMYLVRPCSIVGVKTELRIADGDQIQITFTGMVLYADHRWKPQLLPANPSETTSNKPTASSTQPQSSTVTPTKSKRSGTTSDTTKDKDTKDKESTKSKEKDKDGGSKEGEPKPKKKKIKKMASSEFIDAKASSDTSATVPSSAVAAPNEKEKKSKGTSSSPTTPRKASDSSLKASATSNVTAIQANASTSAATGDEVATQKPPIHSIISTLPPIAANSIQKNIGQSILASLNGSGAMASIPVIPYVEITPLNYIPGSTMEKFIGTIHLSFIKESFSLRGSDDMNVFTQNLILEAQKIARAHVLALGGNVLSSFNLELAQKFKPTKGQGYCLLTITGDAMLSIPVTSASGVGYRKLATAHTKFGPQT